MAILDMKMAMTPTTEKLRSKMKKVTESMGNENLSMRKRVTSPPRNARTMKEEKAM